MSPSVDPLPAAAIFARQQFIVSCPAFPTTLPLIIDVVQEKHFCYPVEAVKTLRPGKTVDVNKLIELVKVQTNDVLMIKQTCAALYAPLDLPSKCQFTNVGVQYLLQQYWNLCLQLCMSP